MKAMVPSSWPWNSPAAVNWDASRAAAPKSAIRMLRPVESTRMFAPNNGKRNGVNKKEMVK